MKEIDKAISVSLGIKPLRKGIRTVNENGHMMLSPKDAYRLMLKDYPDVMDIGEMCKVLGISKRPAISC